MKIKKTETITLRLSKIDKERILSEAKSLPGFTPSDYIRHKLVNGKITVVTKTLKAEDPEQIRLKRFISNNLNQISRSLHIARENNDLAMMREALNDLGAIRVMLEQQGVSP
ncbi:hypothetical protein HBJ58_05590 [Halomonas desiderata]|uniref:plasmid mobilization protein n=1 Tax=Billgrantia desiderata TaxID=52021 RepID=UPI0017488857|nr:hypothetical protein [Halomonas desiderata]